MRRFLFALCCIAGPMAAQPTRASIGLPGYIDQFPIEDVTILSTVDAPVDKAYAAVKAAFADLKVPLNVDDPTRGIVGNQRIVAQVSFAGYRMSRILDCGENTIAGHNADTYRVTIVFLALLDPQDSSHTKLRLGLVGGAVPPTGSRSDAVQCGSTGVLEAKLSELATARLK